MIRQIFRFSKIILIASLLICIVASSKYSENIDYEKLSKNPIIFSLFDHHIIKNYSWAGNGLSLLYGIPERPIAEVWFASTQQDGLTQVPGTEITLKSLIDRYPENMLGAYFKKKPVFCKILSKDQRLPHILHVGFNEAIEGNREEFIELCMTERTLVMQLKDELAHFINNALQFNEYKNSYDYWVSKQVLTRWSDDTLIPLLPKFMDAFDRTIFHEIRKIRHALVLFLNEIKLEPGQVILSPVGTIHSIVGSHQMHPLAGHPEAKNEAYYIFSVARDSSLQDQIILYFEPQQTSNTTYSPFDFASPIEFKNGAVCMRKDLTKGLDALLLPGDTVAQSQQQAIRFMLERAIIFKPTAINDLMVHDRERPIDDDTLFSDRQGVIIQELIHGTYALWPCPYFTLIRIQSIQELGNKAHVTINHVKNLYHELFVLRGSVSFVYKDTETLLHQGSCIFIPAACHESYALITDKNAELVMVYPGLNVQ